MSIRSPIKGALSVPLLSVLKGKLTGVAQSIATNGEHLCRKYIRRKVGEKSVVKKAILIRLMYILYIKQLLNQFSEHIHIM